MNKYKTIKSFVVFVLIGFAVALSSSSSTVLASRSDDNTLRVSIVGSNGASGRVTSSPSGINCGHDCSSEYDEDRSVTLTATADTGSVFDKWTGQCNNSTNPVCTFRMSSNREVVAHFKKASYTLTVNTVSNGVVTSNVGGINCGALCSAVYSHSTAVTLSQVANSGYQFAGWSGDCTGTGSCSLTMTSNKTIAASFTLIPVDVCPNITGVQTTVPSGMTLNDGQCVPIVIVVIDMCPTMSGMQLTIPEGGCVADPIICAEGQVLVGETCVAIPVDLCPTMSGMQITIPDGGCVADPVDLCTNLEGMQATIPEGKFIDGEGDCVDIVIVDPVDMCPTMSGMQEFIPEGGCVADPIDMCPNLDEVQATIPEGMVKIGEMCIPTPAAQPEAPGSLIPFTTGASTPSASPVGQVLGASTACGVYLSADIIWTRGAADPADVKLLQEFLNDHMSSGLVVNGLYDAATTRAVKAFQKKYSDDVLKPWGLKEGTGVVYKTTLAKINNLKCSELNIKLETSDLVPFSFRRP